MERKHSDRPRMLVISGLPATGKSTVAARLQARLRWPLLAKDAFKERLFDTLGAEDAGASRPLSLASYALMFDVARQLADARIDCILEGNFRWSQMHGAFEALYERVQFTQLWCSAPVPVIEQRLRQRAQSRSRHPAHPDEENLPELLQELAKPSSPLPLRGSLVTFDTTEPHGLDRVVTETLQLLG